MVFRSGEYLMAKARDVCWKMRPLFYAQPHAGGIAMQKTEAYRGNGCAAADCRNKWTENSTKVPGLGNVTGKL